MESKSYKNDVYLVEDNSEMRDCIMLESEILRPDMDFPHRVVNQVYEEEFFLPEGLIFKSEGFAFIKKNVISDSELYFLLCRDDGISIRWNITNIKTAEKWDDFLDGKLESSHGEDYSFLNIYYSKAVYIYSSSKDLVIYHSSDIPTIVFSTKKLLFDKIFAENSRQIRKELFAYINEKEKLSLLRIYDSNYL